MNKQDLINFLNEREGFIKLFETDEKIVINGAGSISFYLDKENNIIKIT